MGHAYANYFSKTNIVCYRKMPENKKFTVSFPGKNSVKVKTSPPPTKKSNNFHLVPAASTAGSCPTYYYWPVIAVLQQCADGTAAV